MAETTWKYLDDQSEDEFLKIARDRYHEGLTDDSDDREEAQDDVRFAAGGDLQWDKVSLDLRRPKDNSRPPRPVITWNQLNGPINQVCNDGRANKPAIKIEPMDGGDPETSDYLQSRIRQIEYETDADIAYDTCRKQVVTSGRGFIRIRTDWKSFDSWEQQIHIDEIENQFSVIVDPAAIQYDRSDADWMFISSRISKDAFNRKHGKDAADSFSAFFGSSATHSGDWVGSDQLIPEVEYWVKQYQPDILLELQNGQSIIQSLVIDGFNSATIVRKREVYIPRIVQYIIDGSKILDEKLWIGSTIPIIPHWGDSMVVDGKRRTYSIIRHSKDPQRIVNLTVSNIAELTAQISKTKYAVAEGQIAGHEKEWEPNSPMLFKQYKLYDSTGRQIPAPVPDQNEPPIQALSMQLGQAIDAVKMGTQIFSAALGDRSNETSGKAINARKLESDVANFHIHDNEARTRKTIGEILIEILPKIDKGKTQVPVRSIDGTTKMVPLNVPFKNDDGKIVTIRPDSGKYSVAISTGPSYTSQRQEAFERYSQVATADKNFMGVAGDLFFRSMDAPGADEIADRYAKAVIPPELRKPEEGQPNIPPEIQQAMAQSKQAVTALNSYAQQLEGKLQQAQGELQSRQMEIESKERIINIQEETKRTIALANLQSREGVELLKQEIASVRHRIEINQQELDRVASVIQAGQNIKSVEAPQPEAPSQPAQSSQEAQPDISQEQLGTIPLNQEGIPTQSGIQQGDMV